jgi:3-hydroxyacyl-CoA dehydrogenase/enoyl-CoA hydratase/3-hydroxybutyryl-CoA epimerase
MLYQSAGLRLECSEQVATLWFDTPLLTRALLLDLGESIDFMQRCRAADVLVVRGALTGPDLEEYAGLTDAESRRGFSRLGQETIQRLADLSNHVPTVAYIDGECTNAGLELALACDFRLAVARPETRIGFDYLDRGLLPCWGATQRLPRLVGPSAALELMLNDVVVPARAAKRLGLADHAFGPRPAKTELWWFLADVQDHERRRRPRAWWRRVRDALTPLPTGAGREEPRRSLIEAVRVGWRRGEAAGYAAERTAFSAHGLHPAGAWRRQQAQRRVAQSREWADVPPPRRVGVTQLDEHGVRLAVAALAAGGSLAVRHADGGWEQLAGSLRQAVDDGRLNAIEMEQRLKSVRVNDLKGCELVFLTGPTAVQAADLLELDESLPSARLVVTSTTVPLARLVPTLIHSGRVIRIDMRANVEVQPTEWTDAATRVALHRWLESSGQRVAIVPVEEAHTASAAA